MALRFGAHMPTAGGLHKAISGGVKIGCDAVQIFTASPRQWNALALDSAKVRTFRRMAEATGVALSAHDSYLINLAASDPELLQKSRNAFLGEMQRAEQLGLEFVVTHMGAHTGSGLEPAIARLAQSLNWLHQQLPNTKVKVALETTAGQGTTLGASFDEFPIIFAQVTEAERLAVCLDTCHIFVAGYDIRNAAKAKAVWDEFDSKVGISRLVCIHANDAQKGLGSRTDRHAHIGEGFIGFAGFQAFLSDSRLPDGLPVVVETPDDALHVQNIWKLKNLHRFPTTNLPAPPLTLL